MKVSIRVGFRANDPVNPLDSALRECKEIGYDGIELMLSPNYPYQVSLPWAQRGPWAAESVSSVQRDSIRQSIARHGIEVATASSDWAWQYASFSGRLSQWDRGVELLKADVDLAADLGAKAILIHVGESQGTWAEIRSIVSRVVERGEKRRLKIGFEAGIFARTGLGGLPELIKLVDEIGSPWFGVYEHCYWPRGEQQPHEEIALVGKRMVALHSSMPNIQVDYRKMLAALGEVGYDWMWTFEVGWDQARAAIGDYRHLMKTAG
ncbi:MAG: sugar phosphate isomerase/epimerase [Chloroflexota bacterium]|nr:MAG: sugar phosphate isomerase/epimerase [Chloroflexota bacterium]